MTQPHPPSKGFGGVSASRGVNSSTGTTSFVADGPRVELEAKDPYFLLGFPGFDLESASNKLF